MIIYYNCLNKTGWMKSNKSVKYFTRRELLQYFCKQLKKTA